LRFKAEQEAKAKSKATEKEKMDGVLLDVMGME